MPEVNWLAVIAAAVVSFFIGGLWYSPVMFLKAWQRGAGVTDAQLQSGHPLKIYGGGLVLSLIAAFRTGSLPDAQASELALVVLTVQVFIAGMTMAGPTFNMQLGVLFWALASALHGGTFWASRRYSIDPDE